MDRDDLVKRLQSWGIATVSRHARKVDGPSAGTHILSKHKDHAPGTRARAERKLLERSGISRRLRMAQSAGLKGPAPMWSCDPAPAKNDADRPHDNLPLHVDIGLPDEVRPMDEAIRALQRQPNGKLRAMIVQEEYTGTGTQKMKCARVQAAYGGKLNKKQYQRELYAAWEFIRGRINA